MSLGPLSPGLRVATFYELTDILSLERVKPFVSLANGYLPWATVGFFGYTTGCDELWDEIIIVITINTKAALLSEAENTTGSTHAL